VILLALPALTNGIGKSTELVSGHIEDLQPVQQANRFWQRLQSIGRDIKLLEIFQSTYGIRKRLWCRKNCGTCRYVNKELEREVVGKIGCNYRKLIGGDVENDQCRNVAKCFRQVLEALAGEIDSLHPFSVGLLQNPLDLFFHLDNFIIVLVLVVVVVGAVFLVNLDQALLGVLEELPVGVVHVVELNEGLQNALLFLRGFLHGLLLLRDVGSPAGLVDLRGPGHAHDLFQLAGQVGFEVHQLGLGLVDLLVGGPGAHDLEDGSGLGDVGYGAGHGGQHFRVG